MVFAPIHAGTSEFIHCGELSPWPSRRNFVAGHAPFAERDIHMEYRRGSLRPDVRRPDHLAPLLDFFGDVLLEIGRRAHHGRFARPEIVA